ncbi:MAG: class I SAM-dependent methyltransferase [Planctomycetota bacterium]
MGTPQFGEHREFWNNAAKADLLIAILDTEDVRDSETAMAAFRDHGERDARGLLGYVHDRATVVDLGCGVGRILAPLSRFCGRAVGVDVSDEMIAQGRAYVGDLAPRLEFVKTDGRTLPDVADASVDFLYSLLVLIHVDRRSSFHYFREIRRVLRPEGIARLQFHNIMSDEALAKFVEMSSTEYPLEFYTEAEVRRLLGAAGLEALQVESSGPYLLVDAVASPADAWLDLLTRDVRVLDHGTDGAAFADPAQFDPTSSGTRWVQFAAPERPRQLEAVAALAPTDGLISDATALSSGFVPLHPGHETRLTFGWNPTTQGFDVSVDGDSGLAFERRKEGTPDGPAQLMLGVLPPAHPWSAATMERYPSLFDLRTGQAR